MIPVMSLTVFGLAVFLLIFGAPVFVSIGLASVFTFCFIIRFLLSLFPN